MDIKNYPTRQEGLAPLVFKIKWKEDIVIPRYTLPEMEKLWAEQKKKEGWFKVELAVLWARERLGEIPQGIYQLAEKVRITKKILARAGLLSEKKFLIALTPNKA